MNKREAFHVKAEPAGVAVETSESAVSKEDVQSSSPSFQDSEKVCGSSQSCLLTGASVLGSCSLCSGGSSWTTVDQERGGPVKTSRGRWACQTL